MLHKKWSQMNRREVAPPTVQDLLLRRCIWVRRKPDSCRRITSRSTSAAESAQNVDAATRGSVRESPEGPLGGAHSAVGCCPSNAESSEGLSSVDTPTITIPGDTRGQWRGSHVKRRDSFGNSIVWTQRTNDGATTWSLCATSNPIVDGRICRDEH